MEMYLISGYTAISIAVFTVLRIPLNRWTVPTTAIGGIALIFALIQLLNYYHPYSDMSRQYLTTAPIRPAASGQLTEEPLTDEEPNLIAWFDQYNLFLLTDGSAAEVTFDSIPGKVFAGTVRLVLPTLGEEHIWSMDNIFDPPNASNQPRIPVLISITDPSYRNYLKMIPSGAHAQAAVYGEQLHQLALVRKTLLRMSAWMNYLPLFS